MQCNIIGAGRLGKNIARALSFAKIISALSVCNGSLCSAAKACQEIGMGTPVETIEQLPPADVLWLCCNDDEIPPLVDLVSQHPCLKAGSFVIHCSGVLSSQMLNPLKNKGCMVASFHPLKAFKTNYLEPDSFHGVDCIIEGDSQACEWLKHTFLRLGACISTIQPENKALYHAAACMASNYLITLASHSEALFLKAGLDAEQSRRMLVSLMQGNITNLQQTKLISESLTGPLARGDIQTILLHLEAIDNSSVKELYKAAGLATLPLTQLTQKKNEALKGLLEK
jgi:predicted short-subunit dehydrogenase-like oxidoreductase (DUF2520 family)